MSVCHALAFGPHPDDVELGCGGTLAALAGRDYDVRIVDLTRGELASNGTPESRAEEAAAAAKVLGIARRENLALPDGGLSDRDDQAVEAVADALRRHRPHIVLAPWRQARHPDHEAASAIIRRAAYLAGLRRYETSSGAAPHRPRAILWYPLRVDLTPSFLVDISATLAAKRAAIACYASQLTRSPEVVPTLANAPRSHDALAAREAMWGGLIGAAAAEAFAVDQALAVDDPVAFFASGAAPTLFPRRS